jgi:hypothetical protein
MGGTYQDNLVFPLYLELRRLATILAFLLSGRLVEVTLDHMAHLIERPFNVDDLRLNLYIRESVVLRVSTYRGRITT